MRRLGCVTGSDQTKQTYFASCFQDRFLLLCSLKVMVKVVCTCDACCNHCFTDSNGRKTIGRQISRQAKTNHFRDQLAKRLASTSSPSAVLGLQKKPRSVNPSAQPRSHPSDSLSQIKVPNLATSKLIKEKGYLFN
jgi:hypothetical protein